jgi:phage-related protein
MNVQINKEVEKFIRSLEKPIIAKVLRTIDLLEKFGHELGLPHSKPMGKRVFELRIRGQQEVRIFYGFNKSSAVLLHGFIKKSQQTPQKELKIAFSRIKDLT